ncbi:MAG: TonB-dependent receptor plug domain-containing protein [Bacteroidota bacterium]
MKQTSLLIISAFLSCIFSIEIKGEDTSLTKVLVPQVDELKSLKRNKTKENKVSIASYFEVEKDEAPGVITTISAQDIEQSGARDLTEILMMVPGFQLASDVQNGLAFGFRGNWAHEGKILWMLDGVPMNEIGYGTYVVGNRMPLAMIDKIEIIRGSGSSLYGGLAGLGVINIISRKSQGINGHRLTASGSFSKNKRGRFETGYLFGGKLANGTEITISANLVEGNRSNKLYQNPTGSSVNFADSSSVSNASLYLVIKKNALVCKQYFEDYKFQATYEPIYSQTRTYFQDYTYTIEREKLILITGARYTHQLPWNSVYGDPTTYGSQDIVTGRIQGTLHGNYKLNNRFQFAFGTEFQSDWYKYFFRQYQAKANPARQRFNGISFYTEINADFQFARISAGVRLDKYAFFKPLLAPRVSITKKFGNFFYKVSENYSYKLPTLNNIVLSNNFSIVPEAIHELQAQVGYNNKQWDVSAVYFINSLDRLIVFSVDSLQNENYRNRGSMNTKGIETEIHWKNKDYQFQFTHSYYQSFGVLNDYIQPTGQTAALALPQHKITMMAGFRLNKHIRMQVSNITRGKFQSIHPTEETSLIITNKPTHQLQLVVQLDHLAGNKLAITAGVFNILNQSIVYSFPYLSGYQPLLEMGREFHLQLSLKL